MIFLNEQHIENLRNLIRRELLPLIDGNFVLLDVPNHKNIGDLLIWQGELEFLKEVRSRMVYTSNIYTHLDSKIDKDNIILMHGGGNFGDVWRLNQDFRNNIIKKFQNNRIIVFPQTIHYSDVNLLAEDVKVFSSHPDLTICARDEVSYTFAKKHFGACKVLLLPDMAFFMNLQSQQTNIRKGKTLILKRVDKELGDETLLESMIRRFEKSGINYDVKDWPGFLESGKLSRRIQYYLTKSETILSKFMVSKPGLKIFVNDKHGLKSKNYKEKLISKGIDFVNAYDSLYSTRLHGFILSVLLNKEVFILDNSYGKNKNFFNTWLKNFERVNLIEKSEA